MEISLSEKLRLISSRLDSLARQRDEARELSKQLLAENQRLEAEINSMHDKLKKRDNDVEYLTVSHKLADNPQALADARVKIKKMIARIDKALALIKDDAAV